MRVCRWQTIQFILFPLRDSAFHVLKHEVVAADYCVAPVDSAGDSVCNYVLNLGVHLLMRYVAIPGFSNYCICNRMRVMFLQTSRYAQTLSLISVAKRNYIYYRRCCVRQSSCLVKYNCICNCCRLEELTTFDGYIVLARFLDCRKHR